MIRACFLMLTPSSGLAQANNKVRIVVQVAACGDAVRVSCALYTVRAGRQYGPVSSMVRLILKLKRSDARNMEKLLM